MDPIQRIGPLDPQFPPVAKAQALRRVARDQPPQADDDQRRRQNSPQDEPSDGSQEHGDDRPGPHIDISA